MSLNNFGAGGSILTKLLQTTCREAGVITRIQLLEGPPHKNWGPKNVQISARFLWTFDFDREYLRNGSTYRTSEKNLINHNPFHVGRKKLGELWSTNKKVLFLTNPSDIFLETTFRPLGGAAPWFFFRSLEIDQGYLAHTPTGTGVPQKEVAGEHPVWHYFWLYSFLFFFSFVFFAPRPGHRRTAGPITTRDGSPKKCHCRFLAVE